MQGAAESCPVRVALPLLLAALQNLIDNAMRYAPADTPLIVRIERQSDAAMQISVLDEGPGLDAEDRIQAVSRFWRGHPKIPGYGLGLSIVEAIARRHGGTLELLERSGGGLEVRLVLPIAVEPTP